ncbi:unnamed protein product [Ambrosiozyma monospora]|uniref:Unnamed protein product n=1 Tax=Ambrosiozyma monospora TaxID=43982 RepID=A0ACB5TTL6_AMBMO|nr:unnamed protein product [Ambrosiozyma monospora]
MSSHIGIQVNSATTPSNASLNQTNESLKQSDLSALNQIQQINSYDSDLGILTPMSWALSEKSVGNTLSEYELDLHDIFDNNFSSESLVVPTTTTPQMDQRWPEPRKNSAPAVVGRGSTNSALGRANEFETPTIDIQHDNSESFTHSHFLDGYSMSPDDSSASSQWSFSASSSDAGSPMQNSFSSDNNSWDQLLNSLCPTTLTLPKSSLSNITQSYSTGNLPENNLLTYHTSTHSQSYSQSQSHSHSHSHSLSSIDFGNLLTTEPYTHQNTSSNTLRSNSLGVLNRRKRTKSVIKKKRTPHQPFTDTKVKSLKVSHNTNVLSKIVSLKGHSRVKII